VRNFVDMHTLIVAGAQTVEQPQLVVGVPPRAAHRVAKEAIITRYTVACDRRIGGERERSKFCTQFGGETLICINEKHPLITAPRQCLIPLPRKPPPRKPVHNRAIRFADGGSAVAGAVVKQNNNIVSDIVNTLKTRLNMVLFIFGNDSHG
jgi:hypothetical protein